MRPKVPELRASLAVRRLSARRKPCPVKAKTPGRDHERATELRRAQARLLRLNRTLQAHNECTHALLTAQDEPTFLQQVCRIIAETCGYSLVWIGFAEQDAAQSVRPVASAGFEQAYLDTLQVSWAETARGHGPTGRALRTGEPQICSDFQKDPCVAPWRDHALQRGLRASVVLPLKSDGKAFGAIAIYARKPNAFSQEETDLLNRLAADVSQGIITLRLRQAHAQAEQALRHSEERFAQAFASNPAAIVITGLDDGLFLEVNETWLALTGYTRDEVIGKSSRSIRLWPNLEARARLVKELEIRGAVRGWEQEFFDRTGQVFVTQLSSQIIEFQGRAAVLSTLVDITAQKQAQETLRQLHQRLEDHIQNTPLAVVEFDADLRVRAWSGGAERLFGWAAAEVLGHCAWDIPWICPEDRGRIQQMAVHLFSGQTRRSVSPNRNLTKDGRLIWCEWYNSTLTDPAGHVQSIQSLVLDVTERKQAEAALRASEEQFHTLADSIPNLAWWTNAAGEITWFNQRWYDYTGTTPQQMQDGACARIHDPQIRSQVDERWKACLATGTPFEMELPLRSADGQFRWFLTRIRPLRDPAGRVVRWFGTATDVTDQRQARLVLARSTEELERLVTERTAKLQELVGELEHFSYTITHDLRAPLRSMKGFAEVVLDLCDASPESEEQALLRRIIQSAERMDLLITDALNYTQALRQELPLTPVDVSALLHGMLESYPEYRSSQAHIALQGEFPLVLANAAGLTQCFSNLLDNALKFAKPGAPAEVRIWAEEVGDPKRGVQNQEKSPPETPSVPRTRPSTFVRILVADRGIGISKTMVRRVFNMFARGSAEHAGTGIGLALVRKVVDRMGGRVGVESELGQGSCFWLELLRAAPGYSPPTLLPSPPSGIQSIL